MSIFNNIKYILIRILSSNCKITLYIAFYLMCISLFTNFSYIENMNEDINSLEIQGLRREISSLQNEAVTSLQRSSILSHDLIQSNRDLLQAQKDNFKLRADLFLSESSHQDTTESFEHLTQSYERQTRYVIELRQKNMDLVDNLNRALEEKYNIAERLKESDLRNMDSQQQIQYYKDYIEDRYNHRLRGGN